MQLLYFDQEGSSGLSLALQVSSGSLLIYFWGDYCNFFFKFPLKQEHLPIGYEAGLFNSGRGAGGMPY